MASKMVAMRLFMLLACYAIFSTSADYKCISSSDKAVKVSISNRRNQTGHLISQVEFQHKTSKSEDAHATKETNLWTVDVEQRTESCEGVEFTSRLTFTVTAPFLQLDSDYELFPGIGYYKFHNNMVYWPRAREICAEEGAHLVILNSEQESEVMKSLLARYPKLAGANENDYAWVGVRELEGVNGQYATIFGVSLNNTGYARWSAGQPGDSSTGDYILVDRNGGLADIGSARGYKQPFICEQEFKS